MFKILILQAWYNLSDEALEKQIARDFMGCAISVLHHAAVLFQFYIMPLCYFSFTSCRCAISVLHHAAVLFQSKYIDCKTVCGALTNSI